jgi:hypothetical protein
MPNSHYANFKYSFPPEKIKLIKDRRIVRKEIKKQKKEQKCDRSLKNDFNKLTSELKGKKNNFV